MASSHATQLQEGERDSDMWKAYKVVDLSVACPLLSKQKFPMSILWCSTLMTTINCSYSMGLE
jgi:hypothetical protein